MLVNDRPITASIFAIPATLALRVAEHVGFSNLAGGR